MSVFARGRTEVTLKTEGMQDEVRSLTLPINATGVQRREKSQVVRGKGRVDLEDVWIWVRGLEKLEETLCT